MNTIILTLIVLGSSWGISTMEAPAAAGKEAAEHKCCHNGQCCGVPDCCTLEGCQSKDCPTRK